MSLFPTFEWSLFNGYLPFFIYLITFFLTLRSFSPCIRKQLLNREFETKKQLIFTLISKFFTLLNIIILISTPLSTQTLLFYFGLLLFCLALSLLVLSLSQYANTPLDTPVTQGLYGYSRHPQLICSWLIFASIGLMIHSSSSLLLLLISVCCSHQALLAEEHACLAKYGDEYAAYLTRVPRYLSPFK